MNLKESLFEQIVSKETSVGPIGLGYAGLALALLLDESGFPVIGFDVDPAKPEALDRGALPLEQRAIAHAGRPGL